MNRRHKRNLSKALKEHWQEGGNPGSRQALEVLKYKRQLKAPVERRDKGLRPLPVDNYYLARAGLETNHKEPLELKPVPVLTQLWNLARTIQEAGANGITLRALAQGAYGYCRKEEQHRCRKAVAYLINQRFYPIVRSAEGRYIWSERYENSVVL